MLHGDDEEKEEELYPGGKCGTSVEELDPEARLEVLSDKHPKSNSS